MSAPVLPAPVPTRPAPPNRPAPGGGAARRAVFLLLAALSLLVGLDAALMLLGGPAPVRADRFPEVHGFLLVLGFVGTLVSLERSVALGLRSGYAAPGLLGLGGALLVSPAPLAFGRSAMLGGAVALVAVYVPLWRRQRDDAVLVQAMGAVLATGAAALWLGGVSVPVLLPWLVGFVVLTIVGERLELARVVITSGVPLLLLSAGFACSVAATLLWPVAGYPALGAVTVALVGWLAVHDVARRTIRATGLPRFMAGSMLAGYLWLAVAGATWLVTGAAMDGEPYDVVIHAVFLGFTISMIMAHAPVILPAVLRRPLPYHPVLLVPAVLLHGSLVLRLWVGDGLGSRWAWQVGGVLNIVALLAFFGCAAWSAARAGRARR